MQMLSYYHVRTFFADMYNIDGYCDLYVYQYMKATQ